MPKHRLTLPPSSWPEDLRNRFERHPLTTAQRTRLAGALGRWLKISQDLGACSRVVSRETWLERTEGLSQEIRNAVRQALAIAFPDATASLYKEDNHRTERSDRREQLRANIARNLARFPDDWRAAAKPLLHVDDSGIGDGILVQAWASSTIKRRLEAAALNFDFCLGRDLAVDITPTSVRIKLREDQSRVESGDRRLGGVAVDIGAGAIISETFLRDLEAFIVLLNRVADDETTYVWRGHEHDPNCGYRVPVPSQRAGVFYVVLEELVELASDIEGALDAARAYAIANALFDT